MVRKTLSILMVVTLLSGAFVFAPAGVETAIAAPNAAVTYNLYATDGYISLADGKPLYIYGFVGGRSTDNLSYYDPTLQAAVPYTGTNSTPQPAPAPSGGMRTAAELPLLGKAQLPGPAIYAATGDVVEIRLKNLGIQANAIAPNDPHSIHLHGLDVDAANDGVPETSVGAVPANLCLDGTSDLTAPYDCGGNGGLAPGAGNVIVYMFTPETPGTSMWHCHQEADIHVQMGMYGALVIYNPTDPAYLNGGPGKGFGGTYNGFKYDKDIIMLLSEVDTTFHDAEGGLYDTLYPAVTVTATNGTTATIPGTSKPIVWNPIDYHPQYWLINGLSFPDTIHANAGVDFNEWNTAYRNYDPFIIGSVLTTTGYAHDQWNTPGEKILLRMINMGYEAQPMHIHGYHLKVLGNDQRPWPWSNRVLWGKPTPFGQGLEKNTILIGSGETYELLLDMGQQALSSTYPVGTQTRYDAASNNEPRSNTATTYPGIPDAGDPAPGVGTYITGPVVTGVMLPIQGGIIANPGPDTAVVNVSTGGQVFPFHNHDDYKATNDGFYPGGQFTAVLAQP